MKKLLICLIILGFMLSYHTPIMAQSSEKLFQQGMMKEEGEGNLTEAIEIYNSIVKNVSADRKLRAKALLHVGICFEKLGNQNARKTYQKLISEYSDQQEIVSLGREKLKGLKKLDPVLKKEGIVATQVWSPAKDTYGVSPDGRYLNYIDWDAILISVQDLHNGVSREITKKGTWKKPMRFPDNSIWSPDGKNLAYYWYSGEETLLHIVNIDTSVDKIIARNDRSEVPWPVSWSPDGNHLLALMNVEIESSPLHDHKIVLINVKDGAIQELKSLNGLEFGAYMEMSPDKKHIVYALQQNKVSQKEDIYMLAVDGSMNKKIVENEANDTYPMWSPDGKSILFISDRYGANDLWKLKVENGKRVGDAEIVKVNLGKHVKLLGITNDESLYFEATNSRTDVYTLTLNDHSGKDSLKALKISKLQDGRNIKPIWSNDGRYVAYCRWEKYKDQLGRQYHLTLYDTKTGTSRNMDTEIYGHLGNYWYQPQWSPDGKEILFHGLIEDKLQGGIFTFDIDTGKKTVIKAEENMSRGRLNEFGAFPTFSSDGKNIFYLSEDKKLILKIDRVSKEETIVFSGAEELLYYSLSNDGSKIAFGNFFNNRNELYVVSISGGEKKRIASVEKGKTPYIICWSKDDRSLYIEDGEYGNIKNIKRISVDTGQINQIFDMKNVFSNGKIKRMDMLPDASTIVVELEVGKGNEVWKLEGIFDE